jgi:hypothetical protein
MNRTSWTSIARAALLCMGLSLGASAADVPALDAAGLARGPYSSMHMIVEKTFLNLDVAEIDVRGSARVQNAFAGAAAGKAYSDVLEAQLAKVALEADHLVIQVKFLRDASFSRWLDAAQESLVKVARSGLVPADECKRVSGSLGQWFKAFEKDGFHKGDRVVYDVRPGLLRTVAVTAAGKAVVDRTGRDELSSRVLLATYFAPGTDYRTPLLKSLLAPAPAPR